MKKVLVLFALLATVLWFIKAQQKSMLKVI